MGRCFAPRTLGPSKIGACLQSQLRLGKGFQTTTSRVERIIAILVDLSLEAFARGKGLKVRACESIRSTQAWLRGVMYAGGLTLMALVIAACGGGSGGGGASSSAEALWVPDFFGANVVVFTRAELRRSGDQAPHRTNQSAALDHPNAVAFDKVRNLWVTSCRGSTADVGSISEFTLNSLQKLNVNSLPNAHTTLVDDGNLDYLDCPYGAQFDAQANLWISNRFYPDVASYTPAQLRQGGALQPNTQVVADVFQAVAGIMFDSAGTLWIADIDAYEVYGYTASTLAGVAGTTAHIEPDIINTSADLGGPAAIAFDRAGNQWVANCNRDNLVMFHAQDIAHSGSPAAAVVISSTAVTSPNGDTDSLFCPDGLAFDKRGNLWVANALSEEFGSIAEFTASQLGATGSPAPKIFIDSDQNGQNLSEPGLIAFGPTVP